MIFCIQHRNDSAKLIIRKGGCSSLILNCKQSVFFIVRIGCDCALFIRSGQKIAHLVVSVAYALLHRIRHTYDTPCRVIFVRRLALHGIRNGLHLSHGVIGVSHGAVLCIPYFRQLVCRIKEIAGDISILVRL